MDPQDRVETVVKTKAGAKQERASSGDERTPGSHYLVAQEQVESVIEDWPAAPKKVAQLVSNLASPRRAACAHGVNTSGRLRGRFSSTPRPWRPSSRYSPARGMARNSPRSQPRPRP